MEIYGRRVPLDSVPEDVLSVMEKMAVSNFDVWLVGGALRDFFLGRVPGDWDIATDASPSQIMSLFPKVIPIGIRHGTVRIHTEKRDIEVTSFNMTGSGGIHGDLGRRDFTVNAMAVSYPGGFLLDPHNGQKDLRSLSLRAVGNERTRFNEDPLRTLRAGRFVSTYGFRIRRETFRALKAESCGLAGVAAERIRDEVCKMLMGQHVANAFEWMRRGGVLRLILPELERTYSRKKARFTHCDTYRLTLTALQHSPFRLRVRLAVLFHHVSDPQLNSALPDKTLCRWNPCECARVAETVMNRWRMSQRQVLDAVTLLQNQLPTDAPRWSDAALRRLIVKVGPELLEDLLDLAFAAQFSTGDQGGSLSAFQHLRHRIHQQLGHGLPLTVADLAVDGRDVMRVLGLEPGPVVGSILRRLHQEVLENPELNKHKILMDFLRKEYDKEL